MTRLTHPARLLLAAGLTASMIPMTGAAHAAPAQVASAPAYGGFATTAWATPVRIELFEPSIPVPTTPQAEVNLGYSKAKADSGQSTGRASYFWPGDAVGEGFKTFAESFGLPPEVADNGYPAQVNSQFPGEPNKQSDEPFPGMVMRTTSGDKTAIAETGFSPDGVVLGPDASGGGDGDGDGGGGDNPLGGLQETIEDLLGGGVPGASATGSSTQSSSTAPAEESGTPGLPPELAALVDMEGYVSVSKMSATESPVRGASRTALGEISLLAGVLKIGGLESVAKTTSDGDKATATGKTAFGKMEIGGQEFAIGPDGIVAQGATTPIPGLSDDPAAALEQLGIKLEVPKPTRLIDGDTATSVSEGLRVIIDTAVLAPVLSALPAGQLGALVPAEAGPLKGLVSGLSTFAPKVVITLGIASATVDTVPPIDMPDLPLPDTAPVVPPAAPGGGDAGSVGGGVPAAPTVDGAPVGDVSGAGQTPVGDLIDAAPASAGLPELFSIPGMLLMGAFAAAAFAGAWMRRLGAAALGMGASCPHGLDSGLPDLRKA